MNTLDMYKIAENEKIDILNYKWTNTKARIFEIDNKQINNSIEEKEILAEELGHYYYNALYYLDTDNIQKKKCEYRAIKWAYSILVPLQKLKEKLTQGLNLYELADYFNVDCKYMIECIDFYVEKYGVLV